MKDREKERFIQESKRALRKRRRIGFIGYMRLLGRRVRYVRAD